jgi:L-alanine-DL-glutamate epimerase-like enolase superfamily enzyme
MIIAKAEAIWVAVPFASPGPPSGFGGTVWDRVGTLLIRIETEDGLVGWGEAFGHNAIPATKAAFEHQIAPLLIGRDGSQISALLTELQKICHTFGRYGQSMFALSGLDTALWDLAAKAAGLPLYRLLGGASRKEIPAYASFLRYGDPQVVHDLCEKAVGEGYTAIKLHERTPAAVAAARDGGGSEFDLMVDTNCPWTVQEAEQIAWAMEPNDLYWLEEPIWPPENFHGLAELRAAAPMRIAAGENTSTIWEFTQMINAGAVDFAQPSVAKVGGVTEMMKILSLCQTNNIGFAPHSPYYGPGFLATLHIVAQTDLPVEFLYGDLEAPLYDVFPPKDGMYHLPEGPGLGQEPNPDVIKDYTVKAA